MPRGDKKLLLIFQRSFERVFVSGLRLFTLFGEIDAQARHYAQYGRDDDT